VIVADGRGDTRTSEFPEIAPCFARPAGFEPATTGFEERQTRGTELISSENLGSSTGTDGRLLRRSGGAQTRGADFRSARQADAELSLILASRAVVLSAGPEFYNPLSTQ
jgi:hypothetical protein